MLTGYNTDIEHQGRTYHVQTEDKGHDNPVIETLIYVGGQILASTKSSYADLPVAERDDDKLAALLERQHQGVVRDIRLGKYDPADQRQVFGDGVITDRTFDDVVKDFIDEAATEGALPEPPGRKAS